MVRMDDIIIEFYERTRTMPYQPYIINFISQLFSYIFNFFVKIMFLALHFLYALWILLLKFHLFTLYKRNL